MVDQVTTGVLPDLPPRRSERLSAAVVRDLVELIVTGEIAEGDGAAEDDDGERRELRGGEAGGVVLAAEAPEQVERGGVKALGKISCAEARGAGSCGRRGRAQCY